MLGRPCKAAAKVLSVTKRSLPPLSLPSSPFSTSGGLRLRKIVQHEPDKDKTITIEGVYIESDRKDKLLQPSEAPVYPGRTCKTKPCDVVNKACHPFCRLNFVHEVKHTDVLILSQFMDSTGKIMNQEMTGLCKRQHTRVEKLIKMAAKSGLFPSHMDQFREEKVTKPGANLNSYYDERTIDIQHLRHKREKKQWAWNDMDNWNR